MRDRYEVAVNVLYASYARNGGRVLVDGFDLVRRLDITGSVRDVDDFELAADGSIEDKLIRKPINDPRDM